MTAASLVPLAGSQRSELPQAAAAGPVDSAERVELTIITRRAAALPRTGEGAPVRLSRAELQRRYGGVPADHELVAEVLTSIDPAIQVTSQDPGARRMTVAGPLGALADAFGADLSLVTSTDPTGAAVTHRYRSGVLQVPAQLDGVVVAVLGLDNRPQAAPHFRFAEAARQQVSYTPAAGRRPVQLPGWHRRHRSHRRDHRARRRILRERSGQLLQLTRDRDPVGHRCRRRRRQQRGRPGSAGR